MACQIKKWQCADKRQEGASGRYFANAKSLRLSSHPRVAAHHSQTERGQQPARRAG
jgi:hypothetical protein